MNQDRRTFIKVTSLASVTLVPVIGTLAQLLGKKEEEVSTLLGGSFNKDLEFHIIDNNLLNLHFYFIGVKKSGSSIVPASDGNDLQSFMIVRLPQMHLSEKGYWIDDWKKPDRKYPNATLSGYSYLAFQLWPDKPTGDKKAKKPHPNKKLKFTLENVLNWNDENNFDLITLVEWFDLKGRNKFELDFRNYTKKPCDDFKNSKTWFKNAEEVNKDFKNEDNYYIKNDNEPKNSFNYKKYKSIIKGFLDKNYEAQGSTNNQFIPITFLEVPQSLCLVPISGVRDDKGKLVKMSKRFWQNKFVNQEQTGIGYRKYEVWNNTLFYKSEVKSKQNDAEKTFKIETPSFRAIGIISDKVQCILPPEECLKECENQKEANYLPSLLDKTELTFLTQFAKENASYDFTQQDFDIKEVNGLFFTGLGIITHLKYYNIDKCPVDKGIDLIEYEHNITQGRDIFIRVARLGYNSKTGQRYKHIIEGKRKIEEEIIYKDISGNIIDKLKIEPTSFIELKQYCECIDKHIEYADDEVRNPTWKQKFKLITNAPVGSILTPINYNTTDFKRNTFKELTVTEKKRIPIRCLYKEEVQKNDVCVLQCLPWFWPTKEEATYQGQKKANISYNDYLLCEYEGKDWSDTNIKAQTPFIFLRATYVDKNDINEANSDYFSGDFFFKNKPEDKQIRDFNLIERRKTYFNNQKIAFTPSLKEKEVPIGTTDAKLIAQINQDNLNASKSKTNILEADFIEHYFNVKAKSSFEDGNIVKTKYVVFPQVLRAKVYVDHIRDLTLQKIPSIVEYQKEYIEHEFKEVIDDASKKYANAAKVILANTDAFINGKEELVNNKYGEIKNALQEAKDKLGNLAVPDIIPDSISLEKFGVTLPKDVGKSIAEGRTVFNNSVQKIASFNPRELLRGKLSDVCGLDLTAILDELIPAGSDNNQTPLFEINKLANKITSELEGSEVFQDIQKDIEAVRNKIKELEDGIKEGQEGYKTLASQINGKEQELINNLKQLSNYIPNAEELNNLIKSRFEQYRTQAFELLLSQIKFENIKGKIDAVKNSSIDYFEKEKAILREEFLYNIKILDKYFDEYEKEKKIFNSLPDEIKKLDTTTLVENYLRQELKKYYDEIETNWKDFYGIQVKNLFETISDTEEFKIGSDVVYYVIDSSKSISSITYEITNDSGKGNPLLVFKPSDVAKGKYVQLENKIKTLQAFVIKNINGNSFQQKAAIEIQNLIKTYSPTFELVEKEVKKFQNQKLGTISKNIQDWERRVNEYLESNRDINAATKDAIVKVKGLISKANPYIDFLRKLDPYFYYSEQQRLTKEVDDIKLRFKQTIYSVLEEVENRIKELYGNPANTPDIINPKTYLDFKQIYLNKIIPFQKALNDFETAGTAIPANIRDDFNKAKKDFGDFKSATVNKLKDEANKSIKAYIEKELPEANRIFEAVYDKSKGLVVLIDDAKEKYQNKLLEYKNYVDSNIKSLGDSMTDQIATFIINHPDEVEKVQQAQNIYRLLTSIKQQDLTYNWSTDKFRDINFGIVSFKKFSNPNTTLKIDVKATTYFTSGKFPPAIEKVVTYSENRFTNFGISFFNSLTVNFNEISFIAGSNHSTRFDVKIKDVKFDGALSFVQAFESWLQTMGKGLILQVHGDHAALGYSLAIPAIKTPGFNIFNLSLNFDLRVYFDKRPLRFGFSLARPDSKFGIAVGIYAGFGFFGIVADPKKGIVEIDCALEAGVWAGISFGPFSGEVKLAFGFRYTKNEFGIRIEGYIVAEGRLSFWIIEVAARIYLGVVSQNSYVEGVCTVTYSVKIGFIKKSFSGSFHKKIAGASSNNHSENLKTLKQFGFDMLDVNSIQVSESAYSSALLASITKKADEEAEVHETKPVSRGNWAKFINVF